MVRASDYDAVKSSELEGWRYAKELEADRAQLQKDMEDGWENAWLAQVERLRTRVTELEAQLRAANRFVGTSPTFTAAKDKP